MIEHTQGVTTRIHSGSCLAFFAFDAGLAINLDRAEALISRVPAAAPSQREALRLRRRAPEYFTYKPAPVRVTRPVAATKIAGFEFGATADVTLYDFGAVSVAFSAPLRCELAHLLTLSDALYENRELAAAARRAVDDLLAIIAGAVSKPGVADIVEDYHAFQIEACQGFDDAGAWLSANEALIARILRSERGELSAQERAEALSARISYGPRDLLLIDWNAALVVDSDAEAVKDVLEFTNVELLELRHLDDRLDAAVDEAFRTVSRRTLADRFPFLGAGDEQRRVAELQVDSAQLFEGINNALKLLGDQYLARVYRLAAARMHLPAWDASIMRKLATLESMYAKLVDRHANRRMEIIEWIIVILIAFEVVMSFIRSK